jgi:hypothetical protein
MPLIWVSVIRRAYRHALDRYKEASECVECKGALVVGAVRRVEEVRGDGKEGHVLDVRVVVGVVLRNDSAVRELAEGQLTVTTASRPDSSDARIKQRWRLTMMHVVILPRMSALFQGRRCNSHHTTSRR